MSSLICNSCQNIPLLVFLPGLRVKFSCCKTILARHFDIDKVIEDNFILRCQVSSCEKRDSNNTNFIFYLNKLICETCYKNYESKKHKRKSSYIENNLIPCTCKMHYSKFIYYEESNNNFYCAKCNYPQNVLKIDVLKKKYGNKLLNYNIIENSVPFCFKKLYQILINDYKKYGENLKAINALFNIENLKKYIENYLICFSPICPDCKIIYSIKLEDKTNNKETIEVSCKCDDKTFNSLEEFEKHINQIECQKCNKIFKQNNIFYDFLSENFICFECMEERKPLDYILFNEICYICCLHKKEFQSYCKKCGESFCCECNNTDSHELILFEKNNTKKYSDEKLVKFEHLNWFKKLKENNCLFFENCSNKCSNKKTMEKCGIEKLRQKIGKVSFETFSKKEEDNLNYNILEIKLCLLLAENSENKIYDSKNELELKKTIQKLNLANTALFKELIEKNDLVYILIIRNVLQSLINNFIKKEYKSFDSIKEDFRILYESYKYINFFKNNQKYKDTILEKLQSIFLKIENLINEKTKIYYLGQFMNNLKLLNKNNHFNINKSIIEQCFSPNNNNIKDSFNIIINSITPKILPTKKLELFNSVFQNNIKKEMDKAKFSTIYEYNKFLEDKNLIIDKEKIKKITNSIKEIEKDIIPEDFGNNEFYNYVNLTNNIYIDQIGYINNDSLNQKFLEEIFKNSYEEEYQFFRIKDEAKKDFLSKLYFTNDVEFYFVFTLIINFIHRISKIIHQGDPLLQFLFNKIENNLDINRYKLCKDKKSENNKYKFEEENVKNQSYKKIFKKNKFQNEIFTSFAGDFIKINIKEVSKITTDEQINKIKKEAQKIYKNINEKKIIKNQMNELEDVLQKRIIFYDQYKILIEYFPQIKQNINKIIDDDEFNEDYIKMSYLNYIDSTKDNYYENLFINLYVRNYGLIIYLMRNIEIWKKNYKDVCAELDSLFSDYVDYKLSEEVLKLFKEKICEKVDDISEIFNEEKEKLISIYETKEKIIESETKKNSNDKLNTNAYSNSIKKMKELSLKSIPKIFSNYFDFDITSFSNTKFDVILYLCQKNLIYGLNNN